jgi:kynurenine formamidase
MKIDITLRITPEMISDAQGNEKKALVGHLGTHFDVMNKIFPLEYTERKGIVFDVSKVQDRDIDIADIDMHSIVNDMFVCFYTGFIEKEGYGTKTYFTAHPQLSNELLEALLQKNISIIGIDFAGVRRGKEHTPMDQHCADHGVFIIENLCNLCTVLENGETFTAHTYPMNYAQMTGLPCRVIADI